MGLIGIILLIGIVKRTASCWWTSPLHAERQEGLAPEEAITQACLLRFRPILMTTMCAILGVLPLMLSSGTGAELRRPLGYAMVGGLILSQILTLFTNPGDLSLHGPGGTWDGPCQGQSRVLVGNQAMLI